MFITMRDQQSNLQQCEIEWPSQINARKLVMRHSVVQEKAIEQNPPHPVYLFRAALYKLIFYYTKMGCSIGIAKTS